MKNLIFLILFNLFGSGCGFFSPKPIVDDQEQKNSNDPGMKDDKKGGISISELSLPLKWVVALVGGGVVTGSLLPSVVGAFKDTEVRLPIPRYAKQGEAEKPQNMFQRNIAQQSEQGFLGKLKDLGAKFAVGVGGGIAGAFIDYEKPLLTKTENTNRILASIQETRNRIESLSPVFSYDGQVYVEPYRRQYLLDMLYSMHAFIDFASTHSLDDLKGEAGKAFPISKIIRSILKELNLFNLVPSVLNGLIVWMTPQMVELTYTLSQKEGVGKAQVDKAEKSLFEVVKLVNEHLFTWKAVEKEIIGKTRVQPILEDYCDLEKGCKQLIDMQTHELKSNEDIKVLLRAFQETYRGKYKFDELNIDNFMTVWIEKRRDQINKKIKAWEKSKEEFKEKFPNLVTVTVVDLQEVGLGDSVATFLKDFGVKNAAVLAGEPDAKIILNINALISFINETSGVQGKNPYMLFVGLNLLHMVGEIVSELRVSEEGNLPLLNLQNGIFKKEVPSSLLIPKRRVLLANQALADLGILKRIAEPSLADFEGKISTTCDMAKPKQSVIRALKTHLKPPGMMAQIGSACPFREWREKPTESADWTLENLEMLKSRCNHAVKALDDSILAFQNLDHNQQVCLNNQN